MTSRDEEGDEHPIRERIRELGFEGDTETVRRLAEEGQRTVDHQLEALNDIDTKAISILKMNLVIASAILTLGSFAANIEAVTIADLDNIYNATALVSLVLSSALAASTYTASDSEVGMDSESIRGVIDANLNEEEFEVAVAQSYAGWIEFNDRTNVLNAPLITLTTLLVVVAVIHLSLGVYEAFVSEHTIYIALVAWVFLLAVVLFAGLPRQLSRAAGVLSWSDLKP